MGRLKPPPKEYRKPELTPQDNLKPLPSTGLQWEIPDSEGARKQANMDALMQLLPELMGGVGMTAGKMFPQGIARQSKKAWQTMEQAPTRQAKETFVPKAKYPGGAAQRGHELRHNQMARDYNEGLPYSKAADTGRPSEGVPPVNPYEYVNQPVNPNYIQGGKINPKPNPLTGDSVEFFDHPRGRRDFMSNPDNLFYQRKSAVFKPGRDQPLEAVDPSWITKTDAPQLPLTKQDLANLSNEQVEFMSRWHRPRAEQERIVQAQIDWALNRRFKPEVGGTKSMRPPKKPKPKPKAKTKLKPKLTHEKWAQDYPAFDVQKESVLPVAQNQQVPQSYVSGRAKDLRKDLARTEGDFMPQDELEMLVDFNLRRAPKSMKPGVPEGYSEVMNPAMIDWELPYLTPSNVNKKLKKPR